MGRWFRAACVLGVACLVCSGCQRLNIDKKIELGPGDVQGAALIDAPKSEQKIKVEFTSSASPVNVFVILGKNEDQIMTELGKKTPKVDIQAKSEKVMDGNLAATIPAGQDYGIYVSGATKKTQVAIKIKTP